MNRFLPVVLAAVLSAGVPGLVKADQPGPDWMLAQQVIEKILKSGRDLPLQLDRARIGPGQAIAQ
ncbi:hypothetical protein [Bradyrhizobium cenepequi]